MDMPSDIGECINFLRYPPRKNVLNELCRYEGDDKEGRCEDESDKEGERRGDK
jgi:hypothetical protein